jgi:hypothetical protein
LISQKLKTSNHFVKGKLVPLMYESDTESDDNNPYLAYLKQKFPFDEEAAARKNNDLNAKIEADLKK